MKKIIFLLAIITIAFVSCDKSDDNKLEKKNYVFGCTDPDALNYNPDANTDNGTCVKPEVVQGGFAIVYTATWCGACGSWGAPKIHELMNVDSNKVVAITAHASGDPMHVSNLYSGFQGCRPSGGGIPSFWVGDVDDGDVSDMEQLLNRTPEASVVFYATQDGNVMNVKTRTQFWEQTSGKYYISVYILEDGIDGSTGSGDYEQSGVSNPSTYKHDFVLRTAGTNDSYGPYSYGDELVDGNIDANDYFDVEFNIDMDPSWNQRVYVAACVWKYDSATGMYSFVNSFQNR